jgi:hypothetical protein
MKTRGALGWVGFFAVISALCGASLLVGCISPGREPEAVTINGGDPETEGVATLMGDVQSIDGRRVGHRGKRFLLKPGCYTVTNVTTWGGASPDAAVTAKLPEIPFMVDMRANYTYVVRIGTLGPAERGAELVVTVVEQDEHGNVEREFAPNTHC